MVMGLAFWGSESGNQSLILQHSQDWLQLTMSIPLQYPHNLPSIHSRAMGSSFAYLILNQVLM